MPRIPRHLLRAALVAAVIPLSLGAQTPTGTITGKVIELNSQRPLSDLQVLVVGTQRGAITNDLGE